MRLEIQREIRDKWRPRPKISHKGDFGRVGIVAGSRGMSGAAWLAAEACLRSGAGLVSVAVPDAVYPVIARRLPDIMVQPFPSTSAGTLARRGWAALQAWMLKQDVLAMGPGLSQVPETQKLIKRIALNFPRRMVLDADALNAFAGHREELSVFSERAILTPHPGEFTRLLGAKPTADQGTRKKLALEASKQFRTTIVLKGHRTVVATGGKIYENTSGNPAMAKAGFGDVLTGMIAALLAQKLDAWDAARFGVYLHGLAADLIAKETGEVSLLASDLLKVLARVIKQVRRC